MYSTFKNFIGVALIALLLSSCSKKQFGGLALYTVRSEMQSATEASLKKVAKIGYKNIEAAGYNDGKFYNMEPLIFKNLLQELKLNPISSHNSSVTLDNADKMMADVKQAGFQYFVVPIPPMGMFKFDNSTMTMGMTGTVEELAKILDELGVKANKAGLELLYHNHDFEFKENGDGIVPIDYLLENCNPDYVNFQMDLFWVTKAGADPVAYFKKYPNRFKMWHVKDMDDQGRFSPVGQGQINFSEILKFKELSGMKYYMVEQDMTFDGLSPFQAVTISHDALSEIGFD